ncbi:MAG: beta-galactosidase [Chloroflexi bacterium]|uniref:beta-galactosidase n=1 Tax=Candidatus Flexifilum breve TaxID=3140694 RepID=UPI0031369EA9|nr:beta-galactosidase [Chloroflexota bacterium]
MGDQPIPLLSGEMHYWRLDPRNWRPILGRIKELGIKIVATYVCWDFHELAPGQYDFQGKTDARRNLLGFLDMLAEEDLWVILRPGPYIYAEWKNNGVPDHAAKYHRLDPAFRSAAETYMAAVTEATRPYLATRGGRVILWQADNEIDPWPHLYTEPLGLGRTAGCFQEYLRERYGEISVLNTAWRTLYRSFDDARAVTELFPSDHALMSRYQDYRNFLHWYVNKVGQWAVDKYRALGVDVPMLLNTYSGVGTQRWAELEKIGDLAGPDIYPSREFLNRGGAKEHAHILEALRYASSYSKLPYIPEYQSGIWHDWLEDVGTLTPNHYRLICLSALQAGAAGWNWYMLVNRDNWYQSPINEWGRTRPPLFRAFQQITALYQEVDPTTLTRLTNTAVTFDPLQRSTERPGQDLLTSLYQADIDYDFFDLSQTPSKKPLLLYAGGSWLSRTGQKRLVEYVEHGGHLVCIGTHPTTDEHFRRLNLLNIPNPAGIVSGVGKLNLALWDGTVESAWLQHYEEVPGEPISITRLSVRIPPSEELLLQFDLATGQQYTIGYTVRRLRGRITVIGLQPTPELLVLLHRQFGVGIPSRSTTPDVTTALFHRDGDYYLIASNVGDEGKTATIQLPAPQSGHWRDLVSGTVVAASGQISVPVARKDSTMLRLSGGQK